MVGGGLNLAGGGVGGTVTSGKAVVVVGGNPRVVVDYSACLVASKCSGLMVVKCCSWGTAYVVGWPLRMSVIFAVVSRLTGLQPGCQI